MAVDTLEALKTSVQRELVEGLMPFWQTQVIDYQNGGFIGRMENDRTIDRRAPKGLILNARLLWSYSALYQYSGEDSLKTLAFRAFDYLIDKFIDPDNGGAFWLLDYQGNPVDDKKKTYGQAFCIYALSEFYKITLDKKVIDVALQIFDLVETNALDKKHGGYIENFERTWKPSEDLRLSAADMNEKKSMNTHLHILEAYTNLYRIWKNKNVEQKLADTLKLFMTHIVNPETHHFNLFFDDEWHPKSERISFGHDIEGSWLIAEAAEVLGQSDIKNKIKELSVSMAEAVLKDGMDRDGGILYEADPTGILDSDKHWWPQAEAVVGFLNAYETSWDDKFLKAAVKTWGFIEKHIIDKKHGEWFWRVSQTRKKYRNEPKISEWKSPYHNCRACIEIIQRIGKIENTKQMES